MIKKTDIYFDYNATTPVHPDVVKEMNKFYLENFGNAGSIHSFGLIAHNALNNARKTIATFIGAKPSEIIFTSGGSEADNLALQGVLYKNKNLNSNTNRNSNSNSNRKPHLIIDKIEHPAVWETAKFLESEGFEVTRLSVDHEGSVNPIDVENAIKENTVLISIMYANNEIGTINPIKEIGQIAHNHNILLHTDAVQALTKVKINVQEENIDLLSVSAHKFYGPKGVGFLYVKNSPDVKKNQSTASKYLRPLMYGGSQEFNVRPATENIPGIVGMAKAIEIADSDFDEEFKRLKYLQKYLIDHILKEIPNTHLNGTPIKNRIPNNINIFFKDVFTYDLMIELDNENIACSVGAACHAENIDPSRVLLGIGLTKEEAASSMRFSIGRWTTKEHIDKLLRLLDKNVPKLRNR